MRITKICAASLLLGVLLYAPSASEAKSLEDLLVEKGVITRTEAMATDSGSPAKVYWNEGTRFEFPDTGFKSGFALNTLQRYTYTDADNDAGAQDTSSFDVLKARLILSGSALHEEFDYFIQEEFAGDGSSLLDAVIRWNACDWGSVQMGQFKTMFARQFLTDDWNLQLPDRSVVTDFFTIGRDNGAAATLVSEDKMFSLSAGIFNGDSDGEGINKSAVDTNHTGIVSARVHPMGHVDIATEGDLAYSEDANMTIGVAYAYADAENDLGAGLEDVSTNLINADVDFRLKGFSFQAEYFLASADPDSGDDVEPSGFYTQAGYFFVPKKFELAARYGLIDCDDGAASAGVCEDSDKVNEVSAAINYYIWKTNLKASLGWTHLNQDGLDGASDVDTNQWLFQVSSYF